MPNLKQFVKYRVCYLFALLTSITLHIFSHSIVDARKEWTIVFDLIHSISWKASRGNVQKPLSDFPLPLNYISSFIAVYWYRWANTNHIGRSSWLILSLCEYAFLKFSSVSFRITPLSLFLFLLSHFWHICSTSSLVEDNIFVSVFEFVVYIG